MIFGERLKEVRTSKGITQEELAKEVKCSLSAVRKWETARVMPRYNVFIRICKVLDIDPLAFLQELSWEEEI